MICLVFLFGNHFASASTSVAINEIMYDLDGGDIDWVEVQNTGSTDIDLSTLKLLISNSTSNHTINNSSGSTVLHPGDYGVIVGSTVISNYTAKWGSSGNIFTASFTLPNDTAKVEINNDDKTSPISSVTYTSTQGAAGDGNSLSLISSAWSAVLPTPASVNSTASTPPASGGGTTTTTTEEKSTETEIPSVKVDIISRNTIVAGVANIFSAIVHGYDGDIWREGRYNWSFGDGETKEFLNGEKFEHIYLYPGTYVVMLEYRRYYWTPDPDATDRFVVKIISPMATISKIYPDGGVEVSNDSTNELDLSNWKIIEDKKTFTIPKNTIILSKQKIIFRPSVTGFSSSATMATLNYPMGDAAFSFGALDVAPKVQQEVKSISYYSSPRADLGESAGADLLSASAINSLPEENTIKSKNLFSYIFVLGALILVSGTGVVYFRINSRNKKSSDEDDFELAN